MNAILPRLSQDLNELSQRAAVHFASLSASQKLRHRYMQRRSFARFFGGRDMPHEVTLSDADIGLLLAGEHLP